MSKLHRMQFGRKSEKLARQIEQLELRLEELQSNTGEKAFQSPEPASVPVSWGATAAAKPARRPWPDHLPRQTRRHDPKEAVCPQCQGELRKLGEDVSEMLEYVPASFVVIRHVRTEVELHASANCIVQAEAPSRPIERGVAGPGLLAHVLVSKYCDHCRCIGSRRSTPDKEWNWNARRWRTGWAARASCRRRWSKRCRRYVMAAGKLHADDTPVPVLAPGNGKTKTGRLWTYVRDDRPAGDRLRRRYGLPTRRTAKENIRSSICASFAGRCRPMPTPVSISSTRMAASRKPRAGRMCGASFTTWNRRTLRRSRTKRCSGSPPYMRSKNRFVVGRRRNAATCARRNRAAAAGLSAAMVGDDLVETLAQVGHDGRDSLCALALGRADTLYAKMATLRSTTTPRSALCAPWPWAGRTICSQDRMPEENVQRRSTA